MKTIKKRMATVAVRLMWVITTIIAIPSLIVGFVHYCMIWLTTQITRRLGDDNNAHVWNAVLVGYETLCSEIEDSLTEIEIEV